MTIETETPPTTPTPTPPTATEATPTAPTVTNLPADVTHESDQLVHTHPETGARTLLGRVRHAFVELTEWGESFFKDKTPPAVTPAEPAEVKPAEPPSP